MYIKSSRLWSLFRLRLLGWFFLMFFLYFLLLILLTHYYWTNLNLLLQLILRCLLQLLFLCFYLLQVFKYSIEVTSDSPYRCYSLLECFLGLGELFGGYLEEIGE